MTETDDCVTVLEDYRATISELRGNLERLRELVEQQILLETPPRYRHEEPSRSRDAVLSSQTD